VGYTRDGLGATLTLLVAAAHAPLVQMRLPELKARVNSVYGYSAISRITLTQTAPGGFAEGQDPFAPAPGDATRARTVADPVVAARASQVAAPVRDGALRSALEALARNVLSRGSQQKG
jgi:hypothetical protein